VALKISKEVMKLWLFEMKEMSREGLQSPKRLLSRDLWIRSGRLGCATCPQI